MPRKKYDSADELLKDPSGDIARLRGMGITDFAIITYLVRVSEGQPREAAMRALLLGRSLSAEKQLFVRLVLDRFQLPKFSSEAGHMLLDPAIAALLDRVWGGSEKIFISGLRLILWALLMPSAVLRLKRRGFPQRSFRDTAAVCCQQKGLTVYFRNDRCERQDACSGNDEFPTRFGG